MMIIFPEEVMQVKWVMLYQSNEVKCWGLNDDGQLGLGDTSRRGDESNEMGDSLPQVDLGSTFVPTQIAAGGQFTCALSTNNEVKCWGWSDYGQLGYGDSDSRGDDLGEMGNALPVVDLGNSFTPARIIAGNDHTCVLSTSNEVKCFGWNSYGQLGYGDSDSRGDDLGEMGDFLPVVNLGTSFTVSQLSAGKYHNCALSTSNEVKCFGDNTDGKLGYEDTNNRGDSGSEMGNYLPEVNLGSISGSTFTPIEIVAGAQHTCAISDENKVKCFGDNEHGQLGYGDTESRGDDVLEMGDNLGEVPVTSDVVSLEFGEGGGLHQCIILTPIPE
eukprot:460797_1